jgi:hypothetical protein
MRTFVDIPEIEKSWLDKKAKEQGISIAEALNQTLRAAREAEQNHAELASLMDKIQGAWTRGDGLAWQMKMRSDWGS